jgi:hypothetical protein
MEHLAKCHLGGQTAADLEGYAGLSATEVKNLLRTTGMKDVIAQQQGHLDAMATRLRYKMAINAPDIVDRMETRGRDMEGNAQISFSADKFILEQIMPKRIEPRTEVGLNISVDLQVLSEVKGILTELQMVRGAGGNGQDHSCDTYVLEGTEGIELLESSDATQVLGVTGPVGSGPNPDEVPKPDGEPEPHDPD